MSFAQLQQTILDEARQQADEIKGRFKRSVEKEETRIKEAARAVEEEIINQAEREGERRAKQLHQEAQLSARADILRVKQEELDKAVQDATNIIMSWEEKKTRSLIKILLAQIPEEKGSVTPGEKHQQLVSREARRKGLEVKNSTVEGDGGFVYSDAEIEVNMLISRLVQNVFARHRTEIAKLLFE